jgi:hypothetical protein
VEIDLCDAEGSEFFNTCWDLGSPETMDREERAMAFGAKRWPTAKGGLIFHEYLPQSEQRFPASIPAWKFLLGGEKNS